MEQQASKKKKWPFFVFLLLNLLIIGWTAYSEFGKGGGPEGAIEIQWLLLLPALLMWVLSCAAEIIKYALLLKHIDGRYHWRLAMETFFLGKYYDNITPLAVGGQPFQVYHLNKNGLPSGKSAMLPIAAFMTGQFGFILLAIFCFTIGRHLIPSDGIRVSSSIGLAFYAFLPTVLLLFTFFPKPAAVLIKWIISLFAKSKIIKNKEEKINRINQDLLDYRACLLDLLKDGWLFVRVMLLSLLYQVGVCCLPFFVIVAFGGQINFIECYVTTMAIYAAITFVPTPGNAGAAEGSFYAIFSRLTDGHTFWAMMVWRLFCYYSFIIMGFIQMLLTNLKGRKQKG